MKDKYDVEDIELVARNGEGETDEDGVEDDAKFEDEDCSHLRSEVLFCSAVGARVPEMIIASWWVAEVVWAAGDGLVTFADH